jgi:hypothetical protein
VSRKPPIPPPCDGAPGLDLAKIQQTAIRKQLQRLAVPLVQRDELGPTGLDGGDLRAVGAFPDHHTGGRFSLQDRARQVLSRHLLLLRGRTFVVPATGPANALMINRTMTGSCFRGVKSPVAVS